MRDFDFTFELHLRDVFTLGLREICREAVKCRRIREVIQKIKSSEV